MSGMRRLIVMRHAKSSWKSNAPTDHQRPLKGRGKRDAPRIAARLVELGWVPQQILSSDATRTRQTMDGMTPALGANVAVVFTRRLYHGGVEAMRREVATCSGEVETLMVLGHNPGWEEALGWLCGTRETLETACAALLTSTAQSWPGAVIAPGGFRLERIIRPREL